MSTNAGVEQVIVGIASRTPARDERLSGSRHDPQDQRSNASRDADRVLYSPSWRRLAGVTQVLTPFEGLATLHNRLTHSEKVAQVARAIALNLLGETTTRKLIRRLGGLSADVCQAAGLAHDLGHPPFGHIGEEVLDEIAREQLELRDGFEGNAQTMRILTTRRVRSPLYEGLDLTFATLAAVLKYPWNRVVRESDDTSHVERLKSDLIYRREWNKFNVYDEQSHVLETVRGFLPSDFAPKTQTLEASVMDVADDITYAMHDLEDFYLSGSLNVPQILEDLREIKSKPNHPVPENPFTQLHARLKLDYPEPWLNDHDFFAGVDEAYTLLSIIFDGRGRLATSSDEGNARARFSDEISKLLESVKISEEPLWVGGPYLGLTREAWHRIQVLKHITRSYVISAPDVALLQVGQQTILFELIEMLQKWAAREPARLPRLLREELQIADDLIRSPETRGFSRGKFADRGSPNRAYLDYVCTLTDMQCIGLHEKLSGRRPHRAALALGY